LPRVNLRRLLVTACAALAIALACVTGELRGGVMDEGGDSDVAAAADVFEALPLAVGAQLVPPPPGAGVFVDLHFPPSRMATDEVFRPPQSRG
jgi:hypothetical protein